jgi:hypothetical protein
MQQWMKYAGLGAQFFVSIGLMLALGWKLDQWLKLKTPAFIWILPLLIIVYMLIKLIIETNKKK